MMNNGVTSAGSVGEEGMTLEIRLQDFFDLGHHYIQKQFLCIALFDINANRGNRWKFLVEINNDIPDFYTF